MNFTDAQIAGAGVFTRNLLSEWLRVETRSIVVYHSRSIDPTILFNLPANRALCKKAIAIKSIFFRILYEQFVLPFKLSSYSIYFSPTPAIPFLARIISPGTRLIITIHDMIPFFIPHKYGWLRGRYVRWISKYGAIHADHVITVSENSKKDILKISKVADDKITVIYNFIADLGFEAVGGKSDYFLSISTIEPGKNIEVTMDGFKLFTECHPSVSYRFYWVGKVGWGYTLEYLQSLIDQKGLSGKFILLGFVSEERKNELLRGCIAVVYLSHYEGFGLGVLEGFYFNKPAIVSSGSSLPEVVGDAGILCDHLDANDVADAFYRMTIELSKFQAKIPDRISAFQKESQLKQFLTVINSKNFIV